MKTRFALALTLFPLMLSSCGAIPLGTSSQTGSSSSGSHGWSYPSGTSSQKVSSAESSSQETSSFNSSEESSLLSSSSEESSSEESSSSQGYSYEPNEYDEKAVAFTDLPTSKTGVRYADWENGCVSGDNVIGVLVVVISFTDGLPINKPMFEDTFIGNYDADHAVFSVVSYFKYNTYDSVDFRFHFEYYDCPMTSAEAWHYVNDEDERGYFYGNQFLYDVFDEVKARNEGIYDYRNLDGDADGNIDITFFATAEDFEKTPDGCQIYGGAAPTTSDSEYPPDLFSPVLKGFVKTDYDRFRYKPGSEYDQGCGSRLAIHEIGHRFGLLDTYDTNGKDPNAILNTVGFFGMMSGQFGDWFPYEKFACGFLDPYVVRSVDDEITIKLRNSSLYPDAILIPKAEGWNGTAFDEYLMIDVMAPQGTNGFDWLQTQDTRVGDGVLKNVNGGIRITHVDARLVENRADDPAGLSWSKHEIDPMDAPQYRTSINNNVEHRFWNSNGYAKSFESDPDYCHMLDVVPSDRSSKFRLATRAGDWCPWYPFTSTDLFGKGDVFTLDEDNASFTAAPNMNTGSPLGYSVTVNNYNELTYEAIVTITKF